MPSSWRILLTLVSISLIGFLLWYSPPQELAERLVPKESKNRYPEFYLQNTTSKQYTQTGALDYQLSADELRYFSRHISDTPRDLVEYDKPKVLLYNEQGQIQWQVIADTGTSDDTGERIELIGNVVVKEFTLEVESSELLTESLTILPEQKFAETDKPVIIRDQTGLTKTTGLKAFFNQQRIELLDNVSGTYNP